MNGRKFRNPYHFVPISEEIPECIPLGEAGDERSWLGHRSFDQYHADTFSGKLVCRLTTRGPVVVGSAQSGNEKNWGQDEGVNAIKPFTRHRKDGEEEPAIPGSTIRGCVSSVAEAASNSTLRVLDDVLYSRRADIKLDVQEAVHDFSALGLIVKEDGELRLRPLAMPTLRRRVGEGHFELPVSYSGLFPNALLKAYCYNGNLAEAVATYAGGKSPQFYYAQIALDSTEGYQVTGCHVTGSGGVVKNLPRGDQLLLGLRTVGPPQPEPLPGSVRGFVRTLYVQARRSDIPNTKKHEIFIPYPEGMETAATYPISDEALATFAKLAKQRDDENERRLGSEGGGDLLPFCLKGGVDFKYRANPYHLDEGDIVFFKYGGQNVTGLSVSQIWRLPLAGDHPSHDFFGRVNRDLLPMSPKRFQQRTPAAPPQLTPAEALFGFVEEGAGDQGGTSQPLRGLASRVRFSEARFVEGPSPPIEPDWITLKILASPKPPCPPFYFRKHRLPKKAGLAECYIAKRDLDPASHRPQGRKFYLNHPVREGLETSYRTAHPGTRVRLKNAVRPLKPKCKFLFEIDFDNLSGWELGLLLYSLDPKSNFQHKLGMGKALGLGSVRMEVMGLFLVDRLRRYSKESFETPGASRYHRCWKADQPLDWAAFIGPCERAALQSPSGLVAAADADSPESLKAGFLATMVPDVRRSLEKVGKKDVQGVGPPLEAGQTDDEDQTFAWFQTNDRAKPDFQQGLVPLDACRDLPELEKN